MGAFMENMAMGIELMAGKPGPPFARFGCIH